MTVGSGGLGCLSSQGWLSHSLPFQSSSLPFQCTSRATPPPPFGESSGCGDRSLVGEGSHRASSHSGLLQHEGFGLLGADYRPFVPQQAGRVPQVSHGDTSFSSSVCEDRGLDGVDRSAGCLSAGSFSSGFPQISPICSGRSVLPVPGPLFWPDDSTSSLYEGDGSCFRHPPSSEFRLLRYLDDWLILGSSLEEVIRARYFLLGLCSLLGICINREKSNLSPSQCLTCLGMIIQ